jgi:hypothetical protein
MTIRVFPLNGAVAAGIVPPPPAPPQKVYRAGQSLSVATDAATTTSSAVLNFGANNVPTGIAVGMIATDSTTPAAIVGGQTVLGFNLSAGSVTLSANVSANVANGDTIVFSVPFLDLPGDATGDAATIASQGFMAVGSSGATSSRPSNPKAGSWHVDSTLGYAVVFDGTNWRNPVSGASV